MTWMWHSLRPFSWDWIENDRFEAASLLPISGDRIEHLAHQGPSKGLFEPGPDVGKRLDLVREHVPEGRVEIIHGKVGPQDQDSVGQLIREMPDFMVEDRPWCPGVALIAQETIVVPLCCPVSLCAFFHRETPCRDVLDPNGIPSVPRHRLVCDGCLHEEQQSYQRLSFLFIK